MKLPQCVFLIGCTCKSDCGIVAASKSSPAPFSENRMFSGAPAILDVWPVRLGVSAALPEKPAVWVEAAADLALPWRLR
jgi:hypothetical protein